MGHKPFAGILPWFVAGFSSLAFAHGVMETPPSRSALCGEFTNPDQIYHGTAKTPACSTAFAINPLAAYNYMAVVTHSLGRSVVTPLPKNVCGFDGESWKGAETPWDVPMEWPTSPMAPGLQSITWNIVWGPHFDDTHEFKYWMTKSSFVFSPTKPLSWDDFETEPFCVEYYNDSVPTGNSHVQPDKVKSLFTTQCTIPDRSGHHVIYGEWGRTPPTIERFHGCIDVAFGAAAIGEIGKVGKGILKATEKRTSPFRFQMPDLLGRRFHSSQGQLNAFDFQFPSRMAPE